MAKQVRIRNADELARRLREHGIDVKNGLSAAALAAGEVIREAAAAKAPRRTGFLADEIVVGEPVTDGGRVSVAVGPSEDAFYGIFQEVGTAHHAAQPFLRPAIDENGDRAIAAAAAEVEKLIR